MPTSTPHSTSRLGWPALAAFGVVGAATVALEITWSRQLLSMTGAVLGSAAVLLAALTLGMALGAWAGGRLADRARSPLLATGGTMMAAGAIAFVVQLLIRDVRLDDVAGIIPGASATSLAAVTIAGACVLMLPPMIAAGAAFSALTAHEAVVREDRTRGLARIYAAQTTGSVAGALLAGFVMVRTLGVTGSVTAAAAGLVVAGVAFAAAARLPRTTRAPETLTSTDDAPACSEEPTSVASGAPEAGTRHHPDAFPRRAVRATFALAGVALFVLEVAWTRELLLVFGSSSYALATMLASVLAGLATGQWWATRTVVAGDSDPASAHRAATALALAACAALVSVPMARIAPLALVLAYTRLPGSIASYFTAQGLIALLVIGLPSALIGHATPLLTRLAVEDYEHLGTPAGSAYALNALGATTGSITAGFFLVPRFSAKGTIAVAALVLLLATAVLVRAMPPSRRSSHVWPLTAALVVSAALFSLTNAASPLLNVTLAREDAIETPADYLHWARNMKTVYFRDAAQGRVAVFELPDGQLVMRGSGMVEGAHGFIDAQTTETLVRLPHAVAPQTETYLVVGLGTGSTSVTALSAPGVRRVDTVEINPAVVEAARLFTSGELEADNRSRVIVSDARTYLATTDTIYDAIVSEPSYPLSSYSAELFTREFFELARGRLSPGGIYVQWLPAYLLEPKDLWMMEKTFASVYPNATVWYTEGESGPVDFMLVGVNGNDEADPEKVAEALQREGGDVFEVKYLAGPDDLAKVAADPDIELNTDDRPVFEFRVPANHVKLLWGKPEP